MNSLGTFLIIFLTLLVLFLPRRFVYLSLLFIPLYITINQKVMISSLDFYGIRILLLVAWVRAIIKKDFLLLRINKIDKAIILWLISRIIFNMILWRDFQHFMRNLGTTYDVCGLYFIFRIYVRDIVEIKRSLKFMAIIIVPFSILLIIEKEIGFNIFSIFGGVPEFTQIRNGRVRAQGPFLTPILTGTFGATLMPLIMYPLFKKIDIKNLIPLISCGIITYASSSSGPLMAFIFGLFGVIMWKYRKNLNNLILLTSSLLLLTAIVMKAPLWFLFARVSSVLGEGGGYHRSLLIDQFINNYKEWFLFGTNYTSHWMPYQLVIDPNMVDITNEYIAQAIHGGIITFILFFNIIRTCFKYLLVCYNSLVENNEIDQLFIWCVGVALITHLVSFLSVSYFDQIIVYWYYILAIISNLYIEIVRCELNISQY